MGFSSSELFQDDSQLGSIGSFHVSKMGREQKGTGRREMGPMDINLHRGWKGGPAGKCVSCP